MFLSFHWPELANGMCRIGFFACIPLHGRRIFHVKHNVLEKSMHSSVEKKTKKQLLVRWRCSKMANSFRSLTHTFGLSLCSQVSKLSTNRYSAEGSHDTIRQLLLRHWCRRSRNKTLLSQMAK